MAKVLLLKALIIFSPLLGFVLANDADMLQDICVANFNTGLKVNGFPCKGDSNVSSGDFSFSGLARFASVNNSVGSLVTAATVMKIPGLNTLGVSMSRIDFLPRGVNPPHTHPRASEIFFVLKGELYVGFVTTANKLISKTVKKGDVFVFPRGLVHFQKNVGNGTASVIAAFNSQLPGTQQMPAAMFGAQPEIPDEILATALHIETKAVKKIKSNFVPKK